jgi:hypothetical protein
MNVNDIAIRLVKLVESLDSRIVDQCGDHAEELVRLSQIGDGENHRYHLARGAVFTASGHYAVCPETGELDDSSSGAVRALVSSCLFIHDELVRLLELAAAQAGRNEQRARQLVD